MFYAIVKNFQSVVEAKIGVSGFTILRGPSSAGKSSIIKAIYAAMFNRFVPSQVRFGAEAAYVALKFDPDGPVLRVTRRTTGSPDMELGGVSFTKLGRNVPVEVKNLCNVGFLEVGQDHYDLNFFSQFQRPLLLDFSQKKVAEVLSASDSLDDFNCAWKGLLRKRDELNGAFTKLSALVDEGKVAVSEIGRRVEKLGPCIEAIKTDSEHLSFVHSKRDLLDEAFYWCGQLSVSNVKYDLLSDVNADLTALCDCTVVLKDLNNVLDSVGTLSYKEELSSKYRTQIECLDECYSLSVKRDILNGKLHDLRICLSLLLSCAADKDKVEFYNGLLRDDVCPYCGSNIDSDMTTDEITRKRLEVQKKLSDVSSSIAVAKSKIAEICNKYNIAPEAGAIEAERDRVVVECKSLEDSLQAKLNSLSEMDPEFK